MPLQYLKGVGPRKAADLKKAGLLTVEDLLFRFPLRYEDRSRLQPIARLKPGEVAAITGEVLHASLQPTRRPGFRLFSALIQDDSGQIKAVWPNQAFLKDVIKPHAHIVLYGKVEYWGSRGLQITDPEFEILREESAPDEYSTIHTGRIVPVYERTGSVTTNMQRRFVWQALEQLAPESLRSRAGRYSCARSVAAAGAGAPARRTSPKRTHRLRRSTRSPLRRNAVSSSRTSSSFRPGWRCGGSRTRRSASSWCHAWTIGCAPRHASFCRSSSPTASVSVLAEIVADLQKEWPMQRLLQGDVGAGKDDRRAALRGGRSGERLPGRLHGADRDPRRTALPHDLARGSRRRGSASRCSPAAPRQRSGAS